MNVNVSSTKVLLMHTCTRAQHAASGEDAWRMNMNVQPLLALKMYFHVYTSNDGH